MKKLLLLVSIIAVTISSFGQAVQTAPPSKDMGVKAKKEITQSNVLKGDGQVFWTEDFDWENPADPKGWTLPDGWLNEDHTEEDLGYLWEWKNDTLEQAQYGQVLPLNSSTSDNGFMSLNLDHYNRDYYFSDMPSVNSSFTTAPIDCSEHPSVLFKMQHMFRYWSTADMFLYVSADDGVHWAEYDLKMGALISETPGNVSSDTVAHFVANITEAAAGQEAVILKISWSVSRLYYWNIDDLELTEALDNDLQMKHYFVDYDTGVEDEVGGFFRSLPKTQISSYSFESSSRNFGDNEQTGVIFNVDILKNHNSIFNASSEPIDQVTFQWDTLNIEETFTPVDYGHYRMDLSIQQDQEDQLPEDNLRSIDFTVTDSMFSRCDDDRETQCSTWEWYDVDYSHEGDYLTTRYTLMNDAVASSISVYISQAIMGADFRFVLIEITEDELGESEYIELLCSEMMTIDSTNRRNTWVTLPLELDGEGEYLLGGHTYLVGVQYWINVENEDRGDAFWVGSDRSTLFPASASYQYMNEGWNTRSSDLFMCRLNFNDHENIIDGNNEILSTNSLNQNYPNPFTSNTEISYEITSSSDISLEIFDITGKKVMSVDEGYKTAGTYIIKLNADDLNAGVYYYKLIGDNYTSTKKMIVSK
ncbi:T9SS type A sorting domain-containing protein [Bacteroidota bacterium]